MLTFHLLAYAEQQLLILGDEEGEREGVEFSQHSQTHFPALPPGNCRVGP